MGVLDFLTPGVGSVVSGLGSLAGGLFSNQANAKSTAASNQMNMLMQFQDEAWESEQANVNRAFNADQAQQARDFDASQAATNRDFQSSMMDKQYGMESGLMDRSMAFNDAEAQKAMDFSANQAQAQRDYETQMSNTAYQRSVADMKKAGLNPILGVASGGASTPSVASPSGVSASVGAPSVGLPSGNAPTGPAASSSSAHAAMASTRPAQFADVVTPALSTALNAYTGLTRAQEVQANIGKINADTLVSQANARLTDAQTNRTNVGAALDKATTDVNVARLPQINAEIAETNQRAGLDVASAQAAGAAARNSDAQASNAKAQEAQQRFVTQYYQTHGMPGYNASAGFSAGPTGMSGNATIPIGTTIPAAVSDLWNLATGHGATSSSRPSLGGGLPDTMPTITIRP